jgi:hypothetical protein
VGEDDALNFQLQKEKKIKWIATYPKETLQNSHIFERQM